MDRELAETIKAWRVFLEYSWGKVATFAAKHYPDRGYRSGNQTEGMYLCKDAADLLGEDWLKQPRK